MVYYDQSTFIQTQAISMWVNTDKLFSMNRPVYCRRNIQYPNAMNKLFLSAVSSCILLVTSPVVLHAQQGCSYASNTGQLAMQPINQTGNSFIDNATMLEATRLKSTLQVNPYVSFGDDTGSPNACASPQILTTDYLDGYILIGVNLIRESLAQGNQSYIPIVMAHEFGHIVENKYGYTPGGSAKRRELVADYLSGAYFVHRNVHYGYTDFNHTFSRVYQSGDTQFLSANHHGTPQERVACAYEGYRLASALAAQNGFISTQAILQQAVAFVEANY